jgi:hypothetical protein
MQMLANRPDLVSSGFAALGLSEKELHKHAVIETIPFDLQQYEADGTVDRSRSTLLAVVYEPDGAGPRYFTMTLTEAVPHL